MPPKTRIKRTTSKRKATATPSSTSDDVDWQEVVNSDTEANMPQAMDAAGNVPQAMEADPKVTGRLRRLNQRILIPSQFIDTQLIRDLGIESTVRNLTERLNIWGFLSTPVDTFRHLTLEFLSTFEFVKTEDTVSFVLRGEPYYLSLDQLNDLLGFPTNPPADQPQMARYPGYGPRFRSETNFLAAIIGSHYFTQRSSNISHPALRYIQRVLARTLFARGETAGTFNKRETFFLYCMLSRNNNETHLQPNISLFLAERITQIINVSETGGNISVGGMVTKIARALNINPDDGTDVKVMGPNTIDAPYLISSIYIERHGHHYRHITKDHKKVDFPVAPINPLNLDTWCLAGDLEQYQPQPAGAAIPPPEGGISMQALHDQLMQMNETMLTGFAQLNTRIDRVESEQARMSTQLTHMQANAEEDADRTWYSFQVNQRFNDYNVEQGVFDVSTQPIPPRPRRRGRGRHEGSSSHAPPPP